MINLLDPKNISKVSTRKGFREGLYEAGKKYDNIVALCADLTDSTNMDKFRDEFPDRFFDVGVAEQNLVTVASGMAAMGKIPFTSSYAAFSPGRNWEQIRTTVCLNEMPVKIIGSHAGLSVGPDGATHQMLEDIALMRVLPHMEVVVPIDAAQAKQATLAIAKSINPSYLRLARASTIEVTTASDKFELGKAQLLRKGKGLSLIGSGPIMAQGLLAAHALKDMGIDVEVINLHTVKPVDATAIIESAKKTKLVVTLEEAQVNAGVGSLVAEVLSEMLPTRILRLGIKDRFGQSGTPEELYSEYGIDVESITIQVKSFFDKYKQ